MAIDPVRPAGVTRDVGVTLFGRLALTGIAIIGDVLIARALGPDGKGSVALVLTLSGLGAVILGLGFDRSLAVYAAGAVAVARRAFANALLWTLIAGALGALAILVLYGPPANGSGPSGPLAAIMPELTAPQLIVAALALPLELAYAIGLTGLLGRQRVLAYNVLRFMRRALLTTFVLSLMLIGRLDLTEVLVLNLLALGLTVGGIGWAAARAEMAGLEPNLSLLREQLSFGGRTFVGTIAERFHFRANTFILTALISVSATGVFSVALNLSETLWYLPTSVGLVLFSRAVRPEADSAEVASTMTRSMLALMIVASIPLAIVAPTLIEVVYGAPFREAGLALQILLPGVVAYSVVAVLSNYIIARGAPGRVTAVLSLGLVVNLIASILLVDRLGLQGAAIATSISYSVTAAALLVLYRRVSGEPIRNALIVRRGDMTAVLTVVRGMRLRRRPQQDPG